MGRKSRSKKERKQEKEQLAAQEKEGRNKKYWGLAALNPKIKLGVGAALVVVVIGVAALFWTGYIPAMEPDTETTGAETGEENPLATLEMENGGVIEMELFPDIAPNTVNNFIYLAEQDFYDGLTFHRVIPGFMIQGGCPEGTGESGPGYNIEGEFSNNDFDNPVEHERGVVSMARPGDPDGAGSQFFIVVEDTPHLDGDYAAFGEVVDGMEVVDEVTEVETDASDFPQTEQVIKTIEVDTRGVDYPEPDKIE